MTDLAAGHDLSVEGADPRAGGTEQLEQYRRELTGYCYRMLGSSFDAEDAVQDTMVRAWKAFEKFEGRSSVRSWLYRIATNVCLTMIEQSGRRAIPTEFGGPSEPVVGSLGDPQPEATWVTPVPTDRVDLTASDPADVAVARDSVRMAFVAALQHLPARQRVVLILREVLRWKADEVAALLDTTTASVNSALQRARATMATTGLADEPLDPLDDDHAALLSSYVAAFESYDMAALVQLLAEDATQNMPPFALWLQGPDDIAAWMVGPGAACRSSKLLPVQVNGRPGFAQYKPAANGRYEPWAIQSLEVCGGRIVGMTFFLDTSLFEAFGVPTHLE